MNKKALTQTALIAVLGLAFIAFETISIAKLNVIGYQSVIPMQFQGLISSLDYFGLGLSLAVVLIVSFTQFKEQITMLSKLVMAVVGLVIMGLNLAIIANGYESITTIIVCAAFGIYGLYLVLRIKSKKVFGI